MTIIMNDRLPQVTAWTDGSCHPNPGPGGWAALLVFRVPSTGEKIEREIAGRESSTTNNRMEIMAGIKTLEVLTKSCEILIYSDSQLLVKGASRWMHIWKKRGWRRKEGALLNVDLWQELYRLQLQHRVSWEWVRGHNGCPENERVDWLARQARRQKRI